MTSLTIELGARRTWNGLTGGRWVKDVKKNQSEITEGVSHWKHVPAVHKVEVKDSVAEGLKQASEDWEEANKRKQDPDGLMNRMIRVKDIKHLGPDPDIAPPMLKMAHAIADRFAETMAKLIKK